jgi:hypothetical protein
MTIGYDSTRAMNEMGIVYELVLSDRRKEYTVLIPYGGQAISNTAESRLNAIESYLGTNRVIMGHLWTTSRWLQAPVGASRHQQAPVGISRHQEAPGGAPTYS